MFGAYQITCEDPLERSKLVESLKTSNSPWFLLDTCQRLEVYGSGELEFGDTWNATLNRFGPQEAFIRLVRIAAGLESRILGELEVLGQVRNAYKVFNESFGQSSIPLDQVFQDVLGLARKARKESQIDGNLTSLSGLAARRLLDHVPVGEPIAVVGSGALAQSIVRYLAKRGKSPIRVAGRCPDKAMELAMTASGFGAGLDELSHLMKDVRGVITATAAPHPVLYAEHLAQAQEKLSVIDLSVPPDCCDSVIDDERVEYWKLEDIEAISIANQQSRQDGAAKAEEIIRVGAKEWLAKLAG